MFVFPSVALSTGCFRLYTALPGGQLGEATASTQHPQDPGRAVIQNGGSTRKKTGDGFYNMMIFC